MVKKNYLILFLCSMLGSVSLDARRKSRTYPVCGNNKKECKNLRSKCQCYCAYKPGPRNKTADNNPIFIEDDPDGHYCYCKQRDIDKIARDKQEQQDIDEL